MAQQVSAAGPPAAYFGAVLGLAGLGFAWRAAENALGAPPLVAEAIHVVAAVTWAVLLVLYTRKWIVARPAAIAEVFHPVQGCFLGLGGVATMLIAMAARQLVGELALGLFLAGVVWTIGFAAWRTGRLWFGGREETETTAVFYLPAVAGFFVTASGASLFQLGDWAQLAFGAGLFSWLALESVLLRRLFNATPLPPPLRPVLGIHLAPPVVGAGAYLSLNGGAPDLVAHILVGYGLFLALVLAGMMRWILEQPFTPSYWAFTFGATALASAPLRMAAHGDHGAATFLAPLLFALANALVGLIAFCSVADFIRTRLARPGRPARPPQGTSHG